MWEDKGCPASVLARNEGLKFTFNLPPSLKFLLKRRLFFPTAKKRQKERVCVRERKHGAHGARLLLISTC
jgi:hypothetical protein